MHDHPQIKAFADAASKLRAERYWQYCSIGEQVEFLRALGDVLTEVCYHLDVNDVLPAELLEVCQALAAPGTRILPVRPSVGLVLISCLDRRIEQLIADPYDSRNTGAEGYRST